MISNQLVDRYGNLTPMIDYHLQRVAAFERDISFLRQKLDEMESIVVLEGGAWQANPLIDKLAKYEVLLIKHLDMVRRLVETELEREKPTDDEFDGFLKRLNQDSRPHRTRNSGS